MDHFIGFISLFGVSLPNFALGPMLILFFSIVLGLFPVSGRDGFSHLILPAITLGGGFAAIMTRIVRGSMLEEIRQDYVRTARAKGLGERTVLFGHALRNGLIPVITVLGLQAGLLLGGAMITEIIFSWPGLGRLTIPGDQCSRLPAGARLFLDDCFDLHLHQPRHGRSVFGRGSAHPL